MALHYYFGGHTYEFLTTAASWATASTNAQSLGAHLATVTSAAEDAAVFSNATADVAFLAAVPTANDGGGAKYLWLGATDKVAEGTWKWVDDTRVSTYSNWGTGPSGTEPDNYEGAQDAMAMGLQAWPQPSGGIGVAGEWNDVNEGNALYAVVEWDYLMGTSGVDALLGTAANDTLQGAASNDTLDGATGIDTAKYTGTLANFSLAKSDGGYVVRDKTGAEGTDTLVNIESVKFADKTINLAVQAKAAAASQADVTSLTELYVAFFNRIPDGDGMSYWIDQLGAGKTTNQIADAFYSAGVQYTNLTGLSADMSDASFVRVIYKNVLGRTGSTAPQETDVNYWANNLASGVDTRGSLIRTMLGSAHSFKGDTSWGWVADLLDNKLSVAKTFSIDWGLNYNSAEESISQGMAVAAAVTSTDTAAAIALIGVNATDLQLA
jgi:hypothetical protein